MGLLVILLFFLMFNNGGWGNNGNKACAEGLVGADNCQRIIGLHDRISAAQAASTQGFFQLDTKLCSSIAEVIASVRNQGDRTYDATRNVGDAVRDCCCKVEAQLATVLCEIRGVQRDIRESSGLINAKIELEALKAENARAAMECRLVQAQKDCCCEMNQRFDRLDCKLDNMQRDSEIARLTRENEALKNKAIADSTAASVVQSLQGFAHNEESSHERGKEYRDQGSLFTYAPNGGEVEPQHHDREREHDRRDDRRDERRNDRYDDRRDWNLKVGWGTEIWRKRIRVTSMCRSRNSAICFSQFRISFSTFTRKLVKILKNARNCTTSFT